MKKISKKQKLVGFIAILIVAVIIAIVITTSIINSNNQIADEEYSATTINAGSNLIAKYIKKGEKIGEITGTLEVLNTADATATAEDIEWGKTAYVNGVKITGTRTPDNNYTFTDSYGNEVKVPGGFKVVNPEENVTDGIIIEDVSAGDSNTKGSQFVWIPVGDVYTDEEHTEANKKTIKLGRYDFATNPEGVEVQIIENQEDIDNKEWENEVYVSPYYYVERVSSDYNATAKDLGGFITKAYNSGGYYLGRYELGDALAIEAIHSNTGTTNPATCKSGVYPYTFLGQIEASNLCRSLYNSNEYDSDLINSYAWDTAIIFIQTFSDNKDYSIQTPLQSSLAKCGETTNGSIKDEELHIFDMSGNVMEWSTEGYNAPSISFIVRGGWYGSIGTTTGRRMYSINDPDGYRTGRPILYL